MHCYGQHHTATQTHAQQRAGRDPSTRAVPKLVNEIFEGEFVVVDCLFARVMYAKSIVKQIEASAVRVERVS